MLKNLNSLFFIFTLNVIKSSISEYKFKTQISNEELANFFQIANITETNIFDNPYLIQSTMLNIISISNFFDPKTLQKYENRDKLLEYNNLLALSHFYLGEIAYFGLINKKPNLLEGFKHYLISSYFGNPQSLYKLFILFETNIISIIIKTKDYEKIFDIKNILSHIRTTGFYNYFLFTDDYERKGIAVQFLYTSAIGNYQSALTSLGYKYYKGFGVQHSCDNSQKYYKAASNEIVKDMYKRKRPSYYEKVSLEQYEYIGNKFVVDSFEIDEIIDYFKVEAENGHVNYIQQLGQRFLYGKFLRLI